MYVGKNVLFSIYMFLAFIFSGIYCCSLFVVKYLWPQIICCHGIFTGKIFVASHYLLPLNICGKIFSGSEYLLHRRQVGIALSRPILSNLGRQNTNMAIKSLPLYLCISLFHIYHQGGKALKTVKQEEE